MNLSTMLDTADFVSSEEHRFKELPIEARHSICLEISKKRRQSVATSIFIPKELSNHIRFLKKCQRRDSNKKTKIKKPIMNDKSNSANTIAKYKNKYLKRKSTTIMQQKPQQPKQAYMKHPESYPIPNKLTQTFTSERLRTLLEVLREENPTNTAPKQLEIVEQQIPLGTDQNLTISFAVEVPEATTAMTAMTTMTPATVTNNAVGVEVDLQQASELVTDENSSTVMPKQEVLDASYEYVESAALERNFGETQITDYPKTYVEPVLNHQYNNTPSCVLVEDSLPLIVDDNVQQLPEFSQLENNLKQADSNILNFYGYHPTPEVRTKPLASSVEHLELQLLKRYQSIAPHENLRHNNTTSYTTLPATYIAPTLEYPAPQSISFYHRHHEQQHAASHAYTNNFIDYNNAQNFNFQNQPPQPTAVPKQTSISCRHSLHKRHQHYLNYGLQHHGSGLTDPLAAKAWHYTMHKAQVRSSRARRAANAAAQVRLQQSIETTSAWHYPSHGGSNFATTNTTTYPYHILSATHAHQQQISSSASLAYVPPALTRLPSNHYHNAEESYTHPVDLTMCTFYQQPHLQRDPPPPYHHHHHYQSHQHTHLQQQPQQPHYCSQQQQYEILQHQQHQHQQHRHYHYHPQQHQQQQQQHLPPHHSSAYYSDSLTASYPAQLNRLSQAFTHISSTVLPQPATDPSYWYQLQRDLLSDQRSANTFQGIVPNGPALGHAGTYVNNSLF